jgi:hypothetical protein
MEKAGPRGDTVAMLAAMTFGEEERGKDWALMEIACLLNYKKKGKMCCDSGAARTVLSHHAAVEAGLTIRPPPLVGAYPIHTATNQSLKLMGIADVPISLQLHLELEQNENTGRAVMATWERHFVLKDVYVYDLGSDTPMDLYVAWADWRFSQSDSPPVKPLSHLAWMVTKGAQIVDSPRAPPQGSSVHKVRLTRGTEEGPVSTAPQATIGEDDAEATSSATSTQRLPRHLRRRGGNALLALTATGNPTSASLQERLRARFDEKMRHSAAADKLIAELEGSRARIFQKINPAECTQVVEFEVIGEPAEVSFQTKATAKAPIAEYDVALGEWVSRGIIEKMPPDTKSFGFALLIPKPGGKFRLTINPTGINNATKRISPEGGYMPASMLQEAQLAGRRKLGVQLDLQEAFVTALLGPTAQRLSTFTTPRGKYRWKHGWFGWHSFPAWFQKMIMEKVVLPTVEEFGIDVATVLAWIDDLVITADDADTLVQITLFLIDRILAVGGRLSLDKCRFFVTRLDWCGVEVDLETSQYRVAPERVKSLADTPIPKDRTALQHLLGVLRYYYFTVSDHLKQRARIALLDELDVHGIHLSAHWKQEHTTAMAEAMQAITTGDWIMVYDPSQPVMVYTDASGNHGYSVVACQYDPVSGAPRPIAYISKGWLGTQLTGWTPQVKECYAQRQAVCHIMPQHFPYASEVHLLCDNKNLASIADSVDPLIVRWQQNINDTGCTVRRWIPGEWNTIADYGSRTVLPDVTAQVPAEDRYSMALYALPASGETPVQGHLRYPPLVEKIIRAQEEAGAAERASWSGSGYTTAALAGHTIYLYRNRVIVPRDAQDIKHTLLRMVHDDSAHYTGAERSVIQLQRCRVHWVGLHEEVRKYINSCFRCQFAKAQAKEPDRMGDLNPTVPPHPHHTWYCDVKGPFPHGTGYLICFTEATTRMSKIRYVPTADAQQLTEELEETAISFGTWPVIIRTDGGQPFDSAAWSTFCSDREIGTVIGVPYHSQGQGMVETRFKPIAASIMATLGHKAPHKWWEGRTLSRLEFLMNSTYCEPIGMSPFCAMHGYEPRTALSAGLDYTSQNFGAKALEMPMASSEDLEEIVANMHNYISAAQGKASIASSLAQAITKRAWDAARESSDFKVGDTVIIHRTAPNKMLPHFIGPYVITHVTGDGNFVTTHHFIDKTSVMGPVHVGRLLHFDASRSSAADIAEYQLEPGSFIVEDVIEHRKMDDGSLEFHLRWRGTPVTTWEQSRAIKHVIRVKEYCSAMHLPAPGTEPRRAVPTGIVGKSRGPKRTNKK